LAHHHANISRNGAPSQPVMLHSVLLLGAAIVLAP
jgi:hypothetical protein